MTAKPLRFNGMS